MSKKIDPAVSEHMSKLAKRRKRPHKFTTETSLQAIAAREAKRQKSIDNLQHEANKAPKGE